MSNTDKEPPLQSGSVKLYYEMDITYKKARKRIKEREQK